MRTLSLCLLAVFLLSACAAPAATQQAFESDSGSVVTVYRPST